MVSCSSVSSISCPSNNSGYILIKKKKKQFGLYLMSSHYNYLPTNTEFLNHIPNFWDTKFSALLGSDNKVACYIVKYYHVRNRQWEFHTFLFIEQNLQSEADGGRTWLTISLLTGTFSFFREARNLDDSLIAITLDAKLGSQQPI